MRTQNYIHQMLKDDVDLYSDIPTPKSESKSSDQKEGSDDNSSPPSDEGKA